MATCINDKTIPDYMLKMDWFKDLMKRQKEEEKNPIDDYEDLDEDVAGADVVIMGQLQEEDEEDGGDDEHPAKRAKISRQSADAEMVQFGMGLLSEPGPSRVTRSFSRSSAGSSSGGSASSSARDSDSEGSICDD